MTNQITQLRERLMFTVPQCAQYLGVSTHAVIKYENGTRAPSRALVRLIDVLHILEVTAPSIHAYLMPREAPTSPVEEGLPTD